MFNTKSQWPIQRSSSWATNYLLLWHVFTPPTNSSYSSYYSVTFLPTAPTQFPLMLLSMGSTRKFQRSPPPTKSRDPKGLQLEVGAQRAPRHLWFISNQKFKGTEIHEWRKLLVAIFSMEHLYKYDVEIVLEIAQLAKRFRPKQTRKTGIDCSC